MDVADYTSKETQSAGQKAETPEITDECRAHQGQDEESVEKPEDRVTTPEIVEVEDVEVEEALAEALDDIEQVLCVQEVLSNLYSKPL